MARPRRHLVTTCLLGLVILGLVGVLAVNVLLGSVLRQLSNGRLEGADYWTSEPEILSAGMGFDNIIGLPATDEEAVREAGGAWSPECETTSAASVTTVERAYVGSGVDHDDGLPVVFSWPVATETVDPADFRFTLNTGDTVVAHAAGMNPNWENGERNTVVLFGDFGNRLPSSDPDAVFPVRLEIVEDDTPLLLVGPEGEVDAVGLTWTTQTSPYDAGPVLVGAKLNRVGDEAVGEGGVTLLERSGVLPNDELALYDEHDFRLRVLTSGGFSPDGVTGLQPDMFEDFFRIRAGDVVLDEVGVDYQVAGGTLRVVGLSDLGQRQDSYDACYLEDRDNYIDIVLAGDEAAARSITAVEIPALEGGYSAFYNPGGPGPAPFDGVTYTAPGPPDLEPVTIALDDPMRVSRDATANGMLLPIATVVAAAVGGLALVWLFWIRPRGGRGSSG
ncbi:hypothetical protein [Nocardioides caricicola]|uniref:Uncharacterized protein n=1 Tax=Nocardioides caricicola TaxID=634770 RepID=A0ABW0MZ10_9ACTN